MFKNLVKGLFLCSLILSEAHAYSFKFNLLRFGWQDITNGLQYNFPFDSLSPKETVSNTTLTVTTTDGLVNTGKRDGALYVKDMSGMTISSSPSQMTFCGWLKIPTTSTQVLAYYYGFGARDGSATYSGQSWYRFGPLGYHSGVSQVTDDSSSSSNYTAYVSLDNSWHHYCSTLDSSTLTVSVYKDGSLVDSISGIKRWSSGNLLNLLNNTGFTNPQIPLIDEWKLYGRLLSANEIKTLAQK